jgi:quercetin dioxygenase-like cupin family protein
MNMRVIGYEEANAYLMWLKEEGIPVIGGWAIQDLKTVPLHPWPRTGGLGVYVNLTGSEEQTGAYICEIPVGKSLIPEKHMYEELIYIATGAGTCTVWNEGAEDKKVTFEWKAGSVFAPPLNAWHQFTNTSDVPARFFTLTSARVHMNLFHNKEFIFKNNFVFTDRFNSQPNYFSGDGELVDCWTHPVWETNLVKDARTFKIPPFERFGPGSRLMNLELSANTLEAHISEFAAGTYKKAHRHVGGAHITILSGKGYTLVWTEGQPKERLDWEEGTVMAVPELMFHQHFPLGTQPGRQLAFRWDNKMYRFGKWYGMDIDVKSGGAQIEYHDEELEIRQMFEAELAKDGLKSQMDPSLYVKSNWRKS